MRYANVCVCLLSITEGVGIRAGPVAELWVGAGWCGLNIILLMSLTICMREAIVNIHSYDIRSSPATFSADMNRVELYNTHAIDKSILELYDQI